MQVASLLPTQLIWINLPEVSQLEWHPATVANVQRFDKSGGNSSGLVVVHMKPFGKWTQVCLDPEALCCKLIPFPTKV